MTGMQKIRYCALGVIPISINCLTVIAAVCELRFCSGCLRKKKLRGGHIGDGHSSVCGDRKGNGAD